MDPKQLKKLVKTCREMGILHYKGDGFEFTLSHDAPAKVKQSKNISKPNSPDIKFESDTPESDALLFWSASGGIPFGVGEEQGV